MVHAGLTVLWREDRVSFAVHDLAARLEQLKLPAHEGVVVGIDVGRDEGSAEVDVSSIVLEVLDGERRKVLEPVVGVGELLDVLVLETQRLHDLPLVLASAGLCNGLGLLALALVLRNDVTLNFDDDLDLFRRELRGITERLELSLQLVSASFDRHAGAVEPEREQNVPALQPMVADGELGLGQRECVAEMESAVHVGIRKGHEELFIQALPAVFRRI